MGDAPHVLSPCVGACVLDTTGAYCTGCLRALAEITNWTEYTLTEKDAVLERIGARRAAAARRLKQRSP